jgi:hypothetical protein
MALPKQVQQQADEAERLAKELGLVSDEGEQPTAEVVDIKEAETEQPTAEVEVSEAPAAEEPVAVEAEAAPVEQPVEKKEDFEQKFKTLQGKYDSEMARTRSELAEMRQQLQHAQVALSATQQAQEAAAAEEPKAEQPSITNEEVSDYGEELLDVIGRKAVLALNPVLEPILQRLHTLEQGTKTVEQRQHMSERDKVYAALNEQVADWQQINRNDEFKAWLGQVDPYVGALRGDLLNQAFEANDSQRVLAFFKGYLKEQTTVQTDDPAPNAQPATPAQQAAQVDLETLVTPGAATEATTASAQMDDAAGIITQAEIAAFYADVRRGRYKGKDAERAALEQRIVDAANNGRVR